MDFSTSYNIKLEGASIQEYIVEIRKLIGLSNIQISHGRT